ncbi:5-hydroxytryptamine receptor 4-like [Gigantopelta aegis]|uniref:5-hydroxytryptamine receptor 4-like n=1 Tax=Gigantopelta aegis TaxID=1735272 RepID=UPI001B8896CF|nr:5-hydroxytryptamine receptor 4-like [Gigantopelta aegis]
MADLPPPPPPMSSAIKSVYCVFIVMFSLVTLVGNTTVIVAVAKFRTLQKRTNAFIVSVACADIGVAVLAMPFRLYEEWNGGWDLGKWLCLIVNAFDGMFCTASMCNLYTLALERYLAVCRPFLHTKIRNWTTAVILALCWLVPTALWSTLLLTEWHVIGIEDMVACLSQGACPLVLNVPTAMAVSVGTFWIPSALMIMCYWRIFQTARRHARAIQDTTITTAEHDRIKEFNKTAKAAKTLAIVVGCFFVFWLPFFVVIVVDVLTGYGRPIVLKIFVMWFGYINSMLNPFLYYAFNRQFKMAFKYLVLSFSGQQHEDLEST